MNAFQIKLIAVLTMLIDHIGVVFHSPDNDLMLLRYVGRISFPLFVFLIVEGCVHSRDIKRYLGRLITFAFVSQIPFAMLLEVPLLARLNVFFTLSAGVFFVYLYKLALKSDELIPLVFFMGLFLFGFILADQHHFDYGGLGVLFILVGYIARTVPSRNKRLWVSLAFLAMISVFYMPIPASNLPAFVWASVSVVPILFYTGLRGYNKRWSNWLFYGFYPLHLLVLAILRSYM